MVNIDTGLATGCEVHECAYYKLKGIVQSCINELFAFSVGHSDAEFYALKEGLRIV